MGIFNADLEAKMDHFRDPIFRVSKSDPQNHLFLDGKIIYFYVVKDYNGHYLGVHKNTFLHPK